MQASQAKDCTIISTGDSSRIACGTRATIFNMRPVEALQRPESHSQIVFGGGPGVDGSVETKSWPLVIGFSKTFSISRNGHRGSKSFRGWAQMNVA